MQLKDEGDIYKLNHTSQFEIYFQSNHLINTLANITHKQPSEQLQILETIQKQIANFKYKWVFNGLKWLIFFHELIQISNNPTITALIQSLLFEIQPPKAWNKYQQYLLKKLFTPYLQYLLKLSALNQLKQQQQQNQQQNDAFLQYNLIKFAMAEFTTPIHQFTNFFKKCYPRLNKAFALITHDIQLIYHKIKLNYEEHKLSPVNFLQVEQLSTSTLLIPPTNNKRQLEKTIDTNSSKCNNKSSPLLSKEIIPFQDLYGTESGLNC